MATKPTFLHTGSVQLPINRKVQGTYVNGDWVEGGVTVVTAKCNIQPLKPSELMLLPESDRTREWLKVYSDTQLRTGQEGTGGWDADEFVWQGYTYKVMKDYSFAMGVLDHWKAWAARVPTTQN